MDNKPRAEFRLKPCSLRRHNLAAVGYVHNLLHCDGIESQCHTHFATIHTTLQFAESAKTTDKIDAFVRTQIGYTKQLVENQSA